MGELCGGLKWLTTSVYENQRLVLVRRVVMARIGGGAKVLRAMGFFVPGG